MEINLQKISGLPILFDKERMELKFDGDFPFIKKSERGLNELRPYLKNPEAKEGPDPVYYVWRYVHLKSDDAKIRTLNFHYDLILLPPGKIDGEFVKTAGHYHLPYSEIYEVLLGRAYVLAQSYDKNPKNINSVYLTEAGAGEQVWIPPHYGHNIINVFNEPLLMANWISEKAVHDYKPYKNNHGASYYFLDNGNLIDIVKNPNYDSVPEIKKMPSKKQSTPLYSKILNHPEELTALGW